MRSRRPARLPDRQGFAFRCSVYQIQGVLVGNIILKLNLSQYPYTFIIFIIHRGWVKSQCFGTYNMSHNISFATYIDI